MGSKEGLINHRRKGGVDGWERVMTSQPGSALHERWQFEMENTAYFGYARDFLHIQPVGNLEDALLDENLTTNIRTSFPHSDPVYLSPLQRYTVPILAQERGLSLVVKAPTGSGKTAAFLIPAIQTAVTCRKAGVAGPLVLILSNTNNLSLQTLRMANQLAGNTKDGGSTTGATVVGLFGGLDRCQGNVHQDIVVATTGKLLKILTAENYYTKIDLSKLRMLIIDEFDCMIQADKFGLDIKEIFGQHIPKETKERMKIGLFSATVEGKVIQDNLDVLEPLLFSHSPADEPEIDTLVTQISVEGVQGHITQRVFKIDDTPCVYMGNVTNEERMKRSILKHSFTQRLVALLAFLEAEFRPTDDVIPKKKIIVFAEKKVTCNYLATYLMKSGYQFLPVNSDYHPRTVDRIITKLKRSEIQGIVATNKLCRGQDIPEVDHVIVFEMSTDFSNYQHRIGRTGRAGHGGLSTVFFRIVGDNRHANQFVKFLSEHRQKVPKWLYDSSDYGKAPDELSSVSHEESYQTDMDEIQELNLNGSPAEVNPYSDGSDDEAGSPFNSGGEFSDYDDLPVEPP